MRTERAFERGGHVVGASVLPAAEYMFVSAPQVDGAVARTVHVEQPAAVVTADTGRLPRHRVSCERAECERHPRIVQASFEIGQRLDRTPHRA